MSEPVRNPVIQDGSIKANSVARKLERSAHKGLIRWKDVVIWESFWDELESTMLWLARNAYMSGYRAGKKEATNANRSE